MIKCPIKPERAGKIRKKLGSEDCESEGWMPDSSSTTGGTRLKCDLQNAKNDYEEHEEYLASIDNKIFPKLSSHIRNFVSNNYRSCWENEISKLRKRNGEIMYTKLDIQSTKTGELIEEIFLCMRDGYTNSYSSEFTNRHISRIHDELRSHINARLEDDKKLAIEEGHRIKIEGEITEWQIKTDNKTREIQEANNILTQLEENENYTILQEQEIDNATSSMPTDTRDVRPIRDGEPK